MAQDRSERQRADTADVKEALSALGSRCNLCGHESPAEDADACQWVFAQSVERKKKSARCLGYPMGWTLWVDGVRVTPLKRFMTNTCGSCRASLADQVKREVSQRNAELVEKRERHARVAARVALAMVPVPLICLLVYWMFGLNDQWRPLIWGGIGVPVLAAIVWATIKFDYTLESAADVVAQRANEAHDATIRTVLGSRAEGVEVLREDQPKNLDAPFFVLADSVFSRGERTGWTLFHCWGIIDEPGGTRREEKATAWIRENDTLHQDIGDWLESSEE